MWIILEGTAPMARFRRPDDAAEAAAAALSRSPFILVMREGGPHGPAQPRAELCRLVQIPSADEVGAGVWEPPPAPAGLRPGTATLDQAFHPRIASSVIVHAVHEPLELTNISPRTRMVLEYAQAHRAGDTGAADGFRLTARYRCDF